MSNKLYYLAHPVGPNDFDSLETNLDDGAKWWAFLARRGIFVDATWYGLCMVLDDYDPEDRKLGMEIDKIVLKKCDGLILTGKIVSEGMKEELEICINKGVEVINLVGLSFEEAGPFLEHLGL